MGETNHFFYYIGIAILAIVSISIISTQQLESGGMATGNQIKTTADLTIVNAWLENDIIYFQAKLNNPNTAINLKHMFAVFTSADTDQTYSFADKECTNLISNEYTSSKLIHSTYFTNEDAPTFCFKAPTQIELKSKFELGLIQKSGVRTIIPIEIDSFENKYMYP